MIDKKSILHATRLQHRSRVIYGSVTWVVQAYPMIISPKQYEYYAGKFMLN